MDEHVYVVFFAVKFFELNIVFFADVFKDRFHIFKYGFVKNSSSILGNEDKMCVEVKNNVSS